MGQLEEHAGNKIGIDTCGIFLLLGVTACVDAYHNGSQIGDVITSGVDDMGHGQTHPARVETWDVNSDYQGAGIGMEMVRLLVEDAGLGALLPGQKNIGIGGLNALTDEGEGFTRACQKKGYILPFPEE